MDSFHWWMLGLLTNEAVTNEAAYIQSFFFFQSEVYVTDKNCIYLKYTTCCFDIQCELITTTKLLTYPSLHIVTLCMSVVRILKQISDISSVLLTIVTIQNINFPELYLI